MSITRIEDGRMNLQLSSQLMDEVIDEALRHVNRKSREHTILLQYFEELLLVNIDARLIVQVIINLVDNAIKYTLPGSQIRISARSSGPGPCTWSRPMLGWATGCSVWSLMSCNGQIRFGKGCLYPLTEAAGNCFNRLDKRE